MSLKRTVQRLANVVTRLRGEDYLAPMYRQMHREGRFKGNSWRRKYVDLEQAVPDLRKKTVLDFGCGPLGGVAQELGDRVISYDPYVERYASPPWEQSFDVVHSSDVFEHMTWGEIADCLGKIRRSPAEYVFLVISTRRAGKDLPNGANAHILVKPGKWWLKKIQRELGRDFKPVYARNDLLKREVVLCYHRPQA